MSKLYDPDKWNDTTEFTNKYRCFIQQSQQKIANSPEPMRVDGYNKDALTHPVTIKTLPAVDVTMTLASFDDLLGDFEELTKLKQFLLESPSTMNAYGEWKTFKVLSSK